MNHFTFIEEKLIKTNKTDKKKQTHVASVSLKSGALIFSMNYIKDKNLEGKFVKFYLDAGNKAIGWKIMKDIPLAYLEKNYRRLRVYKSTSKEGYKLASCQVSLKSLIAALNIKSEKTFKKLPIKTYQYKEVYGDVLNYIELK